jgi:hypothetical protein
MDGRSTGRASRLDERACERGSSADYDPDRARLMLTLAEAGQNPALDALAEALGPRFGTEPGAVDFRACAREN